MSAPIVERSYLLVKRGLYYRPDSKGYTGIKADAGRYLESDANPAIGVTAIHENDAPQFSDACYHDLAISHLNDTITDLLAALEGFLAVHDYAGPMTAIDRVNAWAGASAFARVAIAKAKGGAA